MLRLKNNEKFFIEKTSNKLVNAFLIAPIPSKFCKKINDKLIKKKNLFMPQSMTKMF